MNNFDWNITQESDFWAMADELQEDTISHAKNLFEFAETADPESLRSLLIQYRFFTIYYIPDLAILIARFKDGPLRSFLADILSDELGYGNTEKAHPRLYDNFLKSIGVDTESLDDFAISDNIELLDNVRRNLLNSNKSVAYGLGLRGMGGECVCQVYLARFYEHIMKNPYIQKNKETIDWVFWDLHIGDHDIEHRIKTRALINQEVVKGKGEDLIELGQGFYHSMVSWRDFWNNIFESVQQKSISRTRVYHEANFQMSLDTTALKTAV